MSIPPSLKLAALALAASAILSSSTASAQNGPPNFPEPTRIPADAEPKAIPLYSGIAPGSEGATHKEVWTNMFGEKWIRNVTRPTLTPFLPKKGKGNGAAVLVIPGGGFKFVSISNEGWPIAQWLADRGVAAFVLKYRVDETPDAEADFIKQFRAMMSGPPRTEVLPEGYLESMGRARVDAQAALRMIRGNAAKWGIDTKRVGMVGFSAGAMTTMATTLANAPDARPDFIAPIYGTMLPVTPPPSPQPMFAALASDDMLFNKQGFGLVESWQKTGGKVELHYYLNGSHGFGSHKKGTTSDLWFDQFYTWMKVQGLLGTVKK